MQSAATAFTYSNNFLLTCPSTFVRMKKSAQVAFKSTGYKVSPLAGTIHTV